MSLYVVSLDEVLLFSFSLWGKIPLREFPLAPSGFGLRDEVTQMKCFLCFSMDPSSLFELLRLFCFFFVIFQSFP